MQSQKGSPSSSPELRTRITTLPHKVQPGKRLDNRETVVRFPADKRDGSLLRDAQTYLGGGGDRPWRQWLCYVRGYQPRLKNQQTPFLNAGYFTCFLVRS
jgi:hypothetical protein